MTKFSDLSGPDRDRVRAEVEAQVAAFESEITRAVAQERAEGGLTELARLRTALTGLRVQARSTVRRTALSEGVALIDARMDELAKQWKELE